MADPSAKPGSPAQFSLRVNPGHPDEVAMWQASVAPMFEIAPLAAEEKAAFAMETLGYFLPGLAISKTTSSACTFVRSRSVIAKSGIENILVQVYLEGSYRLDTEGVRSDVAPGDIVVFDLMRESRIEATAYTNIALTLQRDMLTPMIVEMDKLHGLVLRNGAPRNTLLKSHMLAMHAEVANIGVAEQSAIAQGTAALVAGCLGPSLASIAANAQSEQVATLQLIRRAIDRRLDDLNMGPEALATQFGLSRTSIYRLFEPLGGVRAYIQQRRLMHAYQLITNPSHFDEPISVIASRLGFSESTAFSRAFRNLYKMTPSDVRAAARAGDLSTHHGMQSGEASFLMLNRWLLGLDASGGADVTRRD